MVDDSKADVEAHKRELMASAAMLFAVQQDSGDKVRKQTMMAYGRLVDAHLLIMGVLASGLLRIDGKITPVTSTAEERDALFASFIIGLVVCENTIVEGRYLQALALLRQEMETLAQLKAVREGTRRRNQPPNVKILDKSLARMYGELSAAAHVSNHDMIRSATAWDVPRDDLPGSTSGTRQFPLFDENLARRSFVLHLMLTRWVIVELATDLLQRYAGDGFTEREAEAARLAEKLMQLEGMVTIDDIDAFCPLMTSKDCSSDPTHKQETSK